MTPKSAPAISSSPTTARDNTRTVQPVLTADHVAPLFLLTKTPVGVPTNTSVPKVRMVFAFNEGSPEFTAVQVAPLLVDKNTPLAVVAKTLLLVVANDVTPELGRPVLAAVHVTP